MTIAHVSTDNFINIMHTKPQYLKKKKVTSHKTVHKVTTLSNYVIT